MNRTMIFKNFFLGIVLFAIPWATLFWGEQYVHPAIASIINATVPIFVLLFSWVLLPEEQPIASTSIGVLLGFIGMIWVFSPSTKDMQPSELNVKLGMITIFVMSLSYGFGAVMMKKLAKGQDMIWAFIYQALAASICLAILSLSNHETISHPEKLPQSLAGISYLAVFSTAIASLIYYHLIFEWGALKAVAVTYIVPFVAILVDLFALHMYPKSNEIAGGSLIMAGILLIHWSKTKNLHKFILRKKINS